MGAPSPYDVSNPSHPELESNECKDEREQLLLQSSRSTDLEKSEILPRSSRTWAVTAGFIGSLLLFSLLCVSTKFLAERRSPSKTNSTPAVVIASFSEQDVSWITEVPDPWKIYRYCHDCGHTITSDSYGYRLPVPTSLGREAAVYLTFIIDNYSDLPPYSIFLHGHDTSWHQPERAVDLIRALNFTALDQEGYIPLKCTSASCDPATKHELAGGPQSVPGDGYFSHLFMMMPPFWRWAIGDTLHKDGPDDFYRGVATAQFAVSADTIRQTPLEKWIALRAPLVADRDLHDFDSLLRNITIKRWGLGANTTRETVFGVSEDESTSVNKWSVGVLFELTWHRIFGKEAISCPAEETCRKTFFSDAIQCPSYGKGAITKKEEDIDKFDLQRRTIEKREPCSVNETVMAQIHGENMEVLRKINRPRGWSFEKIFSFPR